VPSLTLAASRPRIIDSFRESDEHFVQEQDHDRRPAASAGPLGLTKTAKPQTMQWHFLFAIPLIFAFGCESPSEVRDTSSSDSTTITDSTLNIQRSFYPNGQVRAEVGMIGDLQHGQLKEFYENGSLKVFQEWQEGVALGQFKIYDEHGAMVYHKTTEYRDYPEGRYLIHSTHRYDTTKSFSVYDRLVLDDSDFLNRLLKVEPKRIKYGQSNNIWIEVLNMETFQPRITNGTIRVTPGRNNFAVQPEDSSQNVILYVQAFINDRRIEFDPVELIVE